MSDTVRVLRLLAGRSAALPMADIAWQLGISRRRVERAVHALRRAGTPIITSSEGVMLSVDPAEVARMAEALDRRAITIHATAAALRRCADALSTEALPWE